MLRLLRVRNFTLIDDLELEFEKGLNLLSGETGAGKSLIVDALGLIAGAKASTDAVRTGEKRAIVEAVLEVPARLDLAALGIDDEGTEVVIRREILTDNRNRVFINSQPSSVAALRSLAPELLDIHGQHEQQTLLDVKHQLALIDRAARSGALTKKVSSLYDAIRDITAELAVMLAAESDKLQRVELLQLQRDEIERTKPQADETDRLQDQVKVLQHSEKLLEAASQGYEILYEAESSVVSILAGIEKSLLEAAQHDSTLASVAEQASSAKSTVEDMAYALRDYLQKIDTDPDQLDHLQSRLADLERLQRKYGPDLRLHLEKVIRELDNLGLTESRKVDIAGKLSQLRKEYASVSGELRTRRHKISKTLEREISNELRSLAMPSADFSIRWQSATEPGPTGMDSPMLMLTSNPGEEAGPLSQIASGGELSRVMLALRSVMAEDGGDKTLVFDEIDAGIGGLAAETVGRKLKELSTSYQVLCVTHLSQIARFSDHHHLIKKLTVDGRTVTRSETLDGNSRVEELARMMSGPDVSEAARRHVREMLKRQ